MMTLKKYLALTTILLSLLLQAACSHSPTKGAQVGQTLSGSQYAELIKKNTRHDLQYDGFYNKYEVYTTFVNSEVQSAQLQKMSDSLEWNESQAQKERDKQFQENAKQTKFMLSFFVPNPRLNDLNKGSSIWKLYLEVDGQRFEGRASRRNGKLEDIQALLPHHNRWSVPYEIVFDVPLSGVEGKSVTFVLASTQGTSRLNF